jgi:hypothetical protein
MAFTSTKIGESVFGNKRVVYGKYVNDGGSTGGDINTGLHHCDMMLLTAWGSSIVADAPTVNEDLSSAIDGSAVTIIATANSSGYWMAIGA